jgi:D-alanyl-D-alanine carboxypeptidase
LIEHAGGAAAFSSMISRYVDDKLTVIVLTNRAGSDAGGLAHEIAGLYVPALKPVSTKSAAR